MGGILFQLFILANVFLIGALTAVAIQHAYAHFHPHMDQKPQPPTLSPVAKERLLQKAEVNFQAVLDHAAGELQFDLKATSDQLGKQLNKLGTEVVEGEMARYHADLDELRARTETALGNAQAEVTAHQTELRAALAKRQAELEAKLVQDMAAEKQRLIQQLDTKLADAVTAFLLETLKHNVDLGAQTAYLTASLEEHKAELTKGITDEA